MKTQLKMVSLAALTAATLTLPAAVLEGNCVTAC